MTLDVPLIAVGLNPTLPLVANACGGDAASGTHTPRRRIVALTRLSKETAARRLHTLLQALA